MKSVNESLAMYYVNVNKQQPKKMPILFFPEPVIMRYGVVFFAFFGSAFTRPGKPYIMYSSRLYFFPLPDAQSYNFDFKCTHTYQEDSQYLKG